MIQALGTEPHPFHAALEDPIARRRLEALVYIGLDIFKVTAMCDDLGWRNPTGGFPYFHVNTPAVDLARWTAGDQGAGDRLRKCIPEWRPMLPTVSRYVNPHRSQDGGA